MPIQCEHQTKWKIVITLIYIYWTQPHKIYNVSCNILMKFSKNVSSLQDCSSTTTATTTAGSNPWDSIAADKFLMTVGGDCDNTAVELLSLDVTNPVPQCLQNLAPLSLPNSTQKAGNHAGAILGI